MAQQGSRFTVDLGSVQLPGLVEKQVETEIRDVVLRALARVEPRYSSTLRRSMFDQFPGRTLGLWLDPDFDPWGDGAPSVEDHTLIIESVMRHPFQILRALGYRPGDQKPSGSEVLDAALRVDQVDEYTKTRIKTVLEVLPAVQEAQASLPRTAARELDELGRRLREQPIEDQIRSLREQDLQAEFKRDGFAAGMEIAARLLEHGAGSIYSPDFGFYNIIGDGQSATAKKDAVDTIKDADYLGGVAGGAVGATGVVTIPAGAAAGAAGASAGAAIAAVIDWLW